MAGSTVELFSTSILSNVKVRTRHERFTSVLAIKKIPYVYHDLASDDDAKSRWRRKAKDPQLPGMLVNNEWVGSYDDFEEAVEFGELELFLGVSPLATQAAPAAPHPAQSAVSSKDPSLYPTLPYASEGAGRWKEPDADQFISSLNIKEDELNDADVDALLSDIGKLPSQPASTSENKYVPSKAAAIKPLRLAKMGTSTSISHQRMPSTPSSPSTSLESRASPMARYSASQRSARALAAEAAALTSNRKTSGALLRDAVSQGKTLDDAMEESRMKHIVSQDNIDDLFASLGLSNVDIGDDEVDQFLEQGAIPQGLRLGGDRVHRPTSIADKARDQTVARDLALKAKEKGFGSARTSHAYDGKKPLRLQPASQIGTIADDGSRDTLNGSSRTSTLSKQASTLTEAPSESPDQFTDTDVDKDGKATAKEEKLAPAKIGKDTKDTPVAEAETEEPNELAVTSVDSAISQSASKMSLDARQETRAEAMISDHNDEPATDTKVPESKGAEPERANSQVGRKRFVAEPTAPSLQDVTASENSDPDNETVAEPTAAVMVPSSGAHDEASQDSGTMKPKSSKSSENTKTDTSPSTEIASGEAVSTTDAQEATPLSAAAEPDLTADAAAPPTSEDEAPEAIADKQLETSSSRTDVGQGDGTTQQKGLEEPVKVDGSPISTEKKETNVDDKLELELAQAAMIASRFQDHKADLASEEESSLPILEQATAVLPRSSSLSSSLNVTSPTKSSAVDTVTSPIRSPADSDSKNVDPESPPRLVPTSSFSRQASSSSFSTSRRAIDVSRPIDPTISSPPHSSKHDSPTSPETKKKKGIRSFGLGRDKEKDKGTEKEAISDKVAATDKAAAGMPRHKRTISQILREADAVLHGLDEGSDDDAEDPAMFGGSSVDIEAGGPTRAVRSSSREF
ncbi:uncharacterized protein MEPE_05429 [Melanopsichium pennsylvanicum]|uniref:SH3 domain-containing protein n=2 Tax=Melanopsichium pennsylvanicum TaxID=63383 RepID=A0AAJ4XQ39_9BASI|nr:putative protein [Melanopsichium pennsylvanicum 4]SNX86720.1 uncharacterized protein MEPE_05429 [Melanopsichium pennsylvanicum]